LHVGTDVDRGIAAGQNGAAAVEDDAGAAGVIGQGKHAAGEGAKGAAVDQLARWSGINGHVFARTGFDDGSVDDSQVLDAVAVEGAPATDGVVEVGQGGGGGAGVEERAAVVEDDGARPGKEDGAAQDDCGGGGGIAQVQGARVDQIAAEEKLGAGQVDGQASQETDGIKAETGGGQ